MISFAASALAFPVAYEIRRRFDRLPRPGPDGMNANFLIGAGSASVCAVVGLISSGVGQSLMWLGAAAGVSLVASVCLFLL